ncbi:unnamed protein product (macronuclear) [Paramecium tetraurelia]|uniref:Protein kinase domain-containing protein n=1 Tax=Paramecium tetraurelia TaxID=5888 RepID=A0CYF5_PARTE|nr:uncharacterized protein GSPATT00011422001 [Paramecium tetraurelia]CAK75822.1 unnamed protein product [Paramecium tetraurelia]|eukprot:XP_001443219.1 hypothetical protein (macronuclear) [Paramecium tetraurelia strain d4-2]
MNQLKKHISVKCINFNTQSTNTRTRSISNQVSKNSTDRSRSVSKLCPAIKLPVPTKNSESVSMSNSKPVSKLGKVKIDLGNKATSRSQQTTQKSRSNSQISKEESFPKLLPDFGRMETELLDCQDFMLQLPEIQFPTTEDIMKERIILANRIAYTTKTKKRIPITTPDFYKVSHLQPQQGKGAFAKVCLGIQILTGAKVAMKIIEKSTLKTESAKKRLLLEITLMKILSQYQQFASLFEVFETKKQIYIIMEYVEGGDLMKWTKEKPIPEGQAKNLFGQLILALQILQSHNILHRDIKLDNILLQGDSIKICDFGVSRQIIKGQKILEQCGTPAYLAPEVISNKTGYEGFASDIWSSGVLLYILLVGKVPFKGNNMNELNHNIQNGLLNFMEMKKYNLSNDAVDLIKSILNVNPKLRITLTEILNHPWLKELNLKSNKVSVFESHFLN